MNNPAIKIRRYQTQDYQQVWDLHVLALKQTGAYIEDAEFDADLEQIQAVYLDNGGEFLVAVQGERIVAMGAFRKTSNEMAEIKRMRTQPEMQGRGLGQLILQELEARARQAGYQALHLETSALLTAAQKLYLRNGFVETDRIMLRGLESILFEKPL